MNIFSLSFRISKSALFETNTFVLTVIYKDVFGFFFVKKKKKKCIWFFRNLSQFPKRSRFLNCCSNQCEKEEVPFCFNITPSQLSAPSSRSWTKKKSWVTAQSWVVTHFFILVLELWLADKNRVSWIIASFL